MSRRKKSDWVQPANLLTMIGLVLSLTGNFFQWQQNAGAKAQAKEETTRADALQQQRDNWLSAQRKELDTTMVKTTAAEEELRRLYLTMSLENSYVSRQSMDSDAEKIKALLTELRERKALLEQQIAAFMAK